MQLFLITGTSQGLGYALAEQALSEGFTVISISRSCTLNHENHIFVQHDLSSADQLKEKLTAEILKLKGKNFTTVHLINNAAVVTPVGHIEAFSWEDISTHMNINLLLPVYLTSLFLQLSNAWDCTKVITNISSGAALHPIEGWSMYCTSKSGLKMFTDCLATQKSPETTNVKSISLNPGVMDTKMQSTIRDQQEDNFSRVNEFRELKEKNRLASTDKVASVIIRLLRAPDKIQKSWYDVKELY